MNNNPYMMDPSMGIPPAPQFPKFEQGGMVGPGGQPMPAGLTQQGQQQQMNPQMMQMQLNQFVSQNPQQVEQIRQAVLESMQSGELTPQELNMVIQLATVASQNPEMYPQVRAFAIQQGIATEQDLPQQYDQGLVFVLLLAAQAVQQDLGGQNAMAGGSPAQMQSMAAGGKVGKSAKADGGVIIEAHEGEYVIPKHVVEMKGKEFFDSMIAKYSENQGGKS